MHTAHRLARAASAPSASAVTTTASYPPIPSRANGVGVVHRHGSTSGASNARTAWSYPVRHLRPFNSGLGPSYPPAAGFYHVIATHQSPCYWPAAIRSDRPATAASNPSLGRQTKSTSNVGATRLLLAANTELGVVITDAESSGVDTSIGLALTSESAADTARRAAGFTPANQLPTTAASTVAWRSHP